MKKELFNKLFFLLLLIMFGGGVRAQTDLVRWNGVSDGFNPNILVSNISASNITNHGGGSLTNNGQWNQHFQTGSWPSGSLNTLRYVQFTITPDANYKIDLDQFNFEVQMDGGTADFEVRYSKDFSQGYSSFSGTINANWTAKSGSLSSVNPVLPGQTLFVRLYVYNTWNSLRIRHSWGGKTGPTITGVVSPAVTGEPTDLGITKTISNLTPHPGDNVVFTIEVQNLGPNTASGASVFDQLPPGFSYISSTPTVGSYNNGTGIWTIGNLASSTFATLQIMAQMQTAGPYTNTATVSHYGTDPVYTNNSASVEPTNVCGGCTHTIPNGSGNIAVGPGDVYCLHSGTFTGTFSLVAGGIICIADGATFTPSEAPLGGVFNGTIINRGSMIFPLYNSATYTATIENYGTFTSATIQNFAGTLTNYGAVSVTGGLSTPNSGGGEINNYGDIMANAIHFYDALVNNYNGAEFRVTNGVNVYSGFWDNRIGGEVYFNGGNVNFTGDLDNSGYWEFERISSLSSTLNNYGKMKVYNAASNISSTTYLTNDDLLEFIGVPEIQYNGPMLTNNGTITLTHSTTGNFKMNQAINQVFNNGTINVSGQFEQNAAGSLLVNNCTIECKTFFVGNGVAENNGLIWAKGTGDGFEDVKIAGEASILKNSATGHIRGANFVNSGHISGYGVFYFTGNTNANSSGSIIGDGPNSILFFDASQTGSNIFDQPGGTVTNVMRPDTMVPIDAELYNCTASPSVAGYPPTTSPFNVTLCDPLVQTFSLSPPNVAPHNPVGGQSFTVLYGTVRLFEFGNTANTTNNSTTLTIPGKGTFTANTTTGQVTFTPLSTFTIGTVLAEYRISNSRSGDPIVYPSGRAKITITIQNCTGTPRKVISNPMLRNRAKTN
ncbi:DUF11 domain-containing protein [Sphingobacterium olei]|uniref:DUF11 domain-containing protein n=1 Tax=Sphingobacterium olei TaxID=2571155 RepID=A0A4V5MM70_9SPHI|nr:DUF11 domain-containing protein [Sphingobacterium olei]TJZ59848.1 DUF11 domain-containing protein [Sphingobacterium olei]